MARMFLARSRFSVQCLNSHALHQCAYMLATHIVTSAVLELARATDDVKQDQLRRLADFHERNADTATEELKKQ